MSHIPEDAFERYVAMGPERSYRVLGQTLGVSKRAISRCASREDWPGRLAKIDQESRERSDQRLAETLDEMRTRHLRSLRAIHGRALEALKSFPLNSAAEAVSALEKAIRLERVIVGEPSERSQISLEEVTRREIESLLVAEDDFEDDEEAASG